MELDIIEELQEQKPDPISKETMDLSDENAKQSRRRLNGLHLCANVTPRVIAGTSYRTNVIAIDVLVVGPITEPSDVLSHTVAHNTLIRNISNFLRQGSN
ncbi:hypothetical protein ACHAP8_009515 [Fusarium lateritium]